MREAADCAKAPDDPERIKTMIAVLKAILKTGLVENVMSRKV
jgi:hypothetical protein